MIQRLTSFGRLRSYRIQTDNPPRHTIVSGGLRDLLPSKGALQQRRQVYGLQERDGVEPTSFGAVASKEMAFLNWTEMERAAEVKEQYQARAAEIRQQCQEEVVRTKQRTDRKERSLMRLGEDATNVAKSLQEDLASRQDAQEKQHLALQRQLEERDEEVVRLTQQLKAQKNKCDVKLAELEQQRKQEVTDLQGQCASLETQQRDAASAAKQTETNLKQQRDQDVSSLEDHCAALQREVQNAVSAAQQAEKDLKQQRDQDVSSLEDHCAALQRDLQNAVSAAQAAQHEMDTVVGQFQQQVDEKVLAIDDLNAVIVASASTEQALRRDLQMRNDQVVALEQRHALENSEWQMRLTGLEQERDHMVSILEHQNAGLLAELRDATSAAQQAEKDTALLVAHLRQSDRKSCNAQAELTKAQNRMKAMRDHAQSYTEQRDHELKVAKQAGEKHLESVAYYLLREYNEYKEDLNEQITVLQESVAWKNKLLQTQVSKRAADRIEAEAEARKLESEVHEAVAEIESLKLGQKTERQRSRQYVMRFNGKLATLEERVHAVTCERDTLIAALYPESAGDNMSDDSSSTASSDLADDLQDDFTDEDLLDEDDEEYFEYEQEAERCLRGRLSSQRQRSKRATISKFRKGQ